MQAEDDVQARARLIASQIGDALWRNNNGAFNNGTRWIRFGVGNDSAKINKVWKSSDLIGIRRVLITQEMVGQIIGQFQARECKAPGWSYKGTDREKAQWNFLRTVNDLGGHGTFVNDPEQVKL